MTDQEINEQVAKRLGWRKLEQADYTLDHPYYWLDRNGVQADLKDWATSISAAWELVDAMKQQNEVSLLYGHTANDPLTRHWFFQVGSIHNENYFKADADTASMAICLAFLKMT